jgi:hypothetical protein
MMIGSLVVGCAGVDSQGTDETVAVSSKLSELGVDRANVSRSGGDTDVELVARDGQRVASLHYSGDRTHAAVSWHAIAYAIETTESMLSIHDDRGEAAVARLDDTGTAHWDAGADVVNAIASLDLVATVAGDLDISGPWQPLPDPGLEPYIGASCFTARSICGRHCDQQYGGLWGTLTGQDEACWDGCNNSYEACLLVTPGGY